jgi:putative ABC transport system substrate-binding protein
MKLWLLALVAAFSALLPPAMAVAQRNEEVPHIGYMSPGNIPRFDNAFLQGLEEQGYIVKGEIARYDDALWQGLVKKGAFEGRKIRITIRATTEGYPDSAREVAAELVRLNVDLLLAATPPEAQAAQQAVRRASKSIPIVFGPAPDPVGAGLVPSLARPPSDTTGLSLSDPELEAKRLEILRETLPRLARVVYLRDLSFYPYDWNLRAKNAAQAAARKMGLRLEIIDVESEPELEAAFAQIPRSGAQAMLVMNGALFLTLRDRIVKFAAKERLPAMYADALPVEAGGLMFYGTPYADWYGHTASVVARILRGAKPADIPVERRM